MAYADRPLRGFDNGLVGYRFLFGPHKLNSFNMSKANESSSNGRITPKSNRHAHVTGTSIATLTLQVSNPHGIVRLTDLAAEMQKHFDEEKNAKNKAYAFILASGMFTQFAEFCQAAHSDDWHATCMKQLELLVTEQN
jgi:hypothetical protein